MKSTPGQPWLTLGEHRRGPARRLIVWGRGRGHQIESDGPDCTAGATLQVRRHWTKSAGRAISRGVALPRVQPIIPTRRKEPFDDPDWLFEFKYDGFRGLCYLERSRNRFISRNGNR